VRDLLVPGAPQGASFVANRGEILGFAGLVGAGRTELMQTIFGATPSLGGTMLLDGAPYLPRNIRDAIARGVYLAPEDRKRHGLVLPMTIAENTSLPDIANYSRGGWLNRRREKQVAEAEVARLRTRTPSIRQKVVNLSGGNQQKVVLAKWLATKPRVLILDEPTRGIDIGAKVEVHRIISELAASGLGIILISSDLPEVLAMSDRIVVLHEGRVTAEIPRQMATEERVMFAATGSLGEEPGSVAGAQGDTAGRAADGTPS
jgi:ribose transport system ATP-binding protein